MHTLVHDYELKDFLLGPWVSDVGFGSWIWADLKNVISRLRSCISQNQFTWQLTEASAWACFSVDRLL